MRVLLAEDHEERRLAGQLWVAAVTAGLRLTLGVEVNRTPSVRGTSRRPPCFPWRAGKFAKAIHVLELREA